MAAFSAAQMRQGTKEMALMEKIPKGKTSKSKKTDKKDDGRRDAFRTALVEMFYEGLCQFLHFPIHIR